MIEFVSGPEPADRAELVAFFEALGWWLESGPVTCPDCVDEALRQGRTAES